MIEALDHVNLRTGQLDTMVDWYGRVLMMQPGARPAFGFPGAWLYAGDQAVIHLIEDGAVDGPGGDTLALEHFALRATGYADFIARLEEMGIPYRLSRVPPGPVDVVQVNIHDPDGNHIHIDFTAADVAR
ncbi:VOC family protein [Alterinioella nitratireducens]|jgi:catechol 2,3-dioxygenase-like lactoylglutathione lyase family enzyme|uniref:VOC family protein n=1 Tax=Alterinioella nitratireducens TaxID=2735915 RepID=UPI00155606E0|nr:VOC family protein [Alterinioella nitratireducens]NPD18224.1 glyoxalase [Alterinioella nitratireducens]